MTVKTIDELIEGVIEREGGYTPSPAGNSEPVCWGISASLARQQGYMDELRYLSRSEAAAFYLRLYWIQPRFDEIAKPAKLLAEQLFYLGLRVGTGTSVGFLQRALNALNARCFRSSALTVDRRVGSKTLAALKRFLKQPECGGEGALLRAIDALHGSHFLRLAEANPANDVLLHNWISNHNGKDNAKLEN